jgi:hypothetical protein
VSDIVKEYIEVIYRNMPGLGLYIVVIYRMGKHRSDMGNEPGLG